MLNLDSFKVVFIGAGNVATQLAGALHQKGVSIVQIYSRTLESAQELAATIGTKATNQLAEIQPDADLYLVSIPDDALENFIPQLTAKVKRGLFIHTSGNQSIEIWKPYIARYGVLYPLQTLSKAHAIDFRLLHIFVEANQASDQQLILQLAALLTSHVHEATFSQRQQLHLAAVFACNFTNHLYAIAAEIAAESGLPFDALLPLIDETAHKIHTLSPAKAQTGPAIRGDKQVLARQTDLLTPHPDLQKLYRLLSERIQKQALTPPNQP